ncbi:MAG: hypothetical protein ACOYMR_02735 [Ilumatobacteraceae bacterium]
MSTTAALRNGRLLRFVLAYAGSVVCEWSAWLAVLVYAEQRSGSAAAGWTAFGLLIPAVLVAPFVGRIADGRHPIRSAAGTTLIRATPRW